MCWVLPERVTVVGWMKHKAQQKHCLFLSLPLSLPKRQKNITADASSSDSLTGAVHMLFPLFCPPATE